MEKGKAREKEGRKGSMGIEKYIPTVKVDFYSIANSKEIETSLTRVYLFRSKYIIRERSEALLIPPILLLRASTPSL